jgi:hypothetical protein
MVAIARHGGRIAHLSGSMSGPGAIRCPPIPGNASQTNINLTGVFWRNMRQAHKGCNSSESGQHHSGQGFIANLTIRHHGIPSQIS